MLKKLRSQSHLVVNPKLKFRFEFHCRSTIKYNFIIWWNPWHYFVVLQKLQKNTMIDSHFVLIACKLISVFVHLVLRPLVRGGWGEEGRLMRVSRTISPF